MKELQYLNIYFKKYKGRLLVGLFITVIATIFRLIVPMKIGVIINVIENYINGSNTDLELVKSELLINILLILGTALLMDELVKHELPHADKIKAENELSLILKQI